MALYDFLKTHCIRLLSVQRDDEDGSISGEFKTISLEEDDEDRYRDEEDRKIDYFAVSYVWGSFEDHKVITIEGHQLKVTPNVHDILNLFCDWAHKEKKVWIWIDAVCINQDDSIEKSVQVPLMSSIYSRAKRAVVWLGQGDESTDTGMDLMRMLALGKKGYPVPRSVISNGKAWAGFTEIAARPWWRRAWTLQESAIPSDVVYYCGAKCLTGNEIRSAVLIASSYNNEHMNSPSERTSLAPLYHRRRIFQWLGHQDLDRDFSGYGRRRPRRETKLGVISLLALLAYQRHALASDPRDYIYSLLGCVKDKDKQLVGPPNYESDVRDVYRHFVRSWVLAYGSLDILAFTQLFRQIPLSENSDLPSWTPNWAVRIEVLSEESNAVPLLVSQPVNTDIGSMLPPRFLRRDLQGRYYRSENTLPSYAAADGMALRVTFSKDMLTMDCTGIQVGIIDGLSAISWHDQTATLIQSTSSVNIQTQAPPDYTTVATDIMLSLCFGRADIYLQYEADARELITELQEALSEDNQSHHAFREWVEVNAEFSIRGVPLRDALHRAVPTESLDEEPDDAHERSSRRRGSRNIYRDDSDHEVEALEDEEAAKHPFSRKFEYATHPHWMARRLFVTEKGAVGMAPSDACKEDIVCVLLGCSVPMLLRPVSEGEYLVVGECYLHGFMEGQAVRGEHDSSSFRLV